MTLFEYCEKKISERKNKNITLAEAQKRILNAIVNNEEIEDIKAFLEIAEKLIEPRLKERNINKES